MEPHLQHARRTGLLVCARVGHCIHAGGSAARTPSPCHRSLPNKAPLGPEWEDWKRGDGIGPTASCRHTTVDSTCIFPINSTASLSCAESWAAYGGKKKQKTVAPPVEAQVAAAGEGT